MKKTKVGIIGNPETGKSLAYQLAKQTQIPIVIVEPKNKNIMTYQKQVDIIEKMQAHGFNVVNCGNCEGIVLFDEETKPTIESETEDFICLHCKETMAYSDCPDYYYEGMPELDEERNNK